MSIYLGSASRKGMSQRRSDDTACNVKRGIPIPLGRVGLCASVVSPFGAHDSSSTVLMEVHASDGTHAFGDPILLPLGTGGVTNIG